jgi:hypothetical protein
MLSILGFITGLAPMLTQMANNITDLQKMKVKAASDHEIAQINSEIEAIHDRRQVLIAEAGSRLNGIARFCFAALTFPVLAKILFWDKVVGPFFKCVGKDPIGCEMFNTDSLGVEIWGVIGAIVGFYFLTSWKNK